MIDKLTYFVALAREQSFRRAAEQCGVAQPTLSAGIKQLEEELGVMLVLRRSRMLGLTPEGERVLEWARRLVGDARAMRQELQGMRTGLSGHIRLAVVPTALASTPMLTGPVLRRHPGLRFTILSCTSDRIRHMLDGLEVDAGITYLGTEILGRVRTVPLYTERYVFVTTVDGALGDRETVRWAELAGVRLCLLTPDMQNRRIVDQLMRGCGGGAAGDDGVRLAGGAGGACGERGMGGGVAGAGGGDVGRGRIAAADRAGGAGSAVSDRAGGAGAGAVAVIGVGAVGRGATAALIGVRYRRTESDACLCDRFVDLEAG